MSHAPLPSERSQRLSARERLLAAADELFYEGGIHTVGIDRVIERAGVAKASLYDCFGSKDALVRAYLQARHEARRARIEARIAAARTPKGKLLAVFDAAAEAMAEPRYRGCAFSRASAEAQPSEGVRSVCDDARAWLRERLTSLAREAGARDAAGLARALVLLYDGAAVSALMDANASAAVQARAAAKVMLDAAIG